MTSEKVNDQDEPKRYSWGGSRPGAGRQKSAKVDEKRQKTSISDSKRVRLSTTISPETQQFLAQMWKDYTMNQGQVVDRLLALAQEHPNFKQAFTSRWKLD